MNREEGFSGGVYSFCGRTMDDVIGLNRMLSARNMTPQQFFDHVKALEERVKRIDAAEEEKRRGAYQYPGNGTTGGYNRE